MRDIYDDDQRSDRGQFLAAQRVAAAPAVWLRRGGLPMSRIGCAATPRHSIGGARNAARGTSTTGC